VRNDRPLSCVMIDVDEFGSLEQRHGQSIGEQTIKVVASVLAGQIRPGDVLCRYGGAQFCVLLTGADQSFAAGWAESVRQAIAGHPLHLAGEKLHVTASFGISDRKNAWQDELVERAEKALRDAQAPGRNRVVVWEQATGKAPVESELSRLAEAFGHAAPACDDVQRVLQHAGLFRHLAARELMTTPVTCVPRDMPSGEAAELLRTRKIRSAPVVNADGSLVGMVSDRDIAENIGNHDNLRAPVEWFMTEGVIQYAPDTPANLIFDFLCRVQIPRVVVVEQQRPVGVISRGTFLRWAQHNAEVLSPSNAACDVTQTASCPASDLGASGDDVLSQLVSGLLSIQDIIEDLRGWSRSATSESSNTSHGQRSVKAVPAV
jgi:diguanylate cyclase (GGDEF)-like protein